MDKLRLVYVPREDATPESELAALVNVYRYLLECAQHKKASELGGDGVGVGRAGGPSKERPDAEGRSA